MTTAAGFEPTRAKPSGFQVHLLNHSDKMSFYIYSIKKVCYYRIQKARAKLSIFIVTVTHIKPAIPTLWFFWKHWSN